jgi:cytosine/adenosine deaminase-related metal-dependent hydrolase
LITIKAAEAVNMAEKTGSIAVGKAADLAAFPLDSHFWQEAITLKKPLPAELLEVRTKRQRADGGRQIYSSPGQTISR